jgi:hypothetical protein
MTSLASLLGTGTMDVTDRMLDYLRRSRDPRVIMCVVSFRIVLYCVALRCGVLCRGGVSWSRGGIFCGRG